MVPLREGGFRFSKDLYPDGVFISSKNERVAVEFEMSRKGVRRVESKVSLYERFMGSWGEDAVIDKVWVIASKASIGRMYKKVINEVARDSTRYRVDSLDQVLPTEAMP